MIQRRPAHIGVGSLLNPTAAYGLLICRLRSYNNLGRVWYE